VAGFVAVTARRWSTPSSQGEWRALLALPAILRSLLPGASADERSVFLRSLDRRIDPGATLERVWYLVVAHRPGSGDG